MWIHPLPLLEQIGIAAPPIKFTRCYRFLQMYVVAFYFGHNGICAEEADLGYEDIGFSLDPQESLGLFPSRAQ